MGLLDDAIREHLELKRRSGADPGEVAREQHEALDPVERSAAPAAGGDSLHAEPPPPEATEPSELPDSRAIAGSAVEDLPDERPPGAQPPDGGGGDETAELDMRTVLGDGATPGVAGGVRPAGGEHAAAAGDRAGADEDSLEWETPGAEAPAQGDHEAPDEDVLEETPDFLRDTPEQERLWFEQRPPRDFDFDK
jgi:hypothetical protein